MKLNIIKESAGGKPPVVAESFDIESTLVSGNELVVTIPDRPARIIFIGTLAEMEIEYERRGNEVAVMMETSDFSFQLCPQ